MSSYGYAGLFTHGGTQVGNNFVPASSADGTGDTGTDPSSHVMYDGSQGYAYGQDESGSVAYPSYTQEGVQGGDDSYSLGFTAYPASADETSAYSNSYSQAVAEYANSQMYTGNYSSRDGGSSGYRGKNWKHPGARSSSQTDNTMYCELCHVSCVGSESYKAHCEGARHKRREREEAAKTSKDSTSSSVSSNMIQCEICEVPCSGPEAYNAHIVGSRHLRVVKLWQQMGKPVPVLNQLPVPSRTPSSVLQNTSSNIRVYGTPQMNFNEGGKLTTTDEKSKEKKQDLVEEAIPSTISNSTRNGKVVEEDEIVDRPPPSENNSSRRSETLPPGYTPVPDGITKTWDDSIPAVGLSYITEDTAPNGLPNFFCKLCNVKIGDPASREQHVRGKRHKYAFKTKVDPSYPADSPNNPKSKTNGDKPSSKGVTPSPRATGLTGRANRQQYSSYQDRYFDNGSKYSYGMRPPPYGSPFYGRQLPWPPGDSWGGYGRNPYAYGGYGGYPNFGPPPPIPRYSAPPPPPLYGPPHPPRFGYGSYRPQPYPYASPASNSPMPPSQSFRPPPPDQSSFPVRNPEDIPSPQERKPLPPFTPDDHLLLEKHTDICPTETDLDRIFLVLSVTERALKLVSDQLTQEDLVQKKGKEEDGEVMVKEETEKIEEESQHRTLKGLMRVGPAAMDLLLAGDKEAELVVICAEKPTESLLIRVVEKLPDQLKAAGAEEDIKVVRDNEGNGILVIHVGTPVEGDVTIKVSLTSPLMRASMDTDEEVAAKILDKNMCLKALAGVRHVKWYQAQVAELQPAPMVIRLLIHLGRSVTSWSAIDSWPLMLLVERVLSTVTNGGEELLSPTDALRHVLEAIASGVLLPSFGPGLLDPCEKEPVDASSRMTVQQKEELTASAQHALRLLAFGQIGKIFGIDKKRPAPEPPQEPLPKRLALDFSEDNL